MDRYEPNPVIAAGVRLHTGTQLLRLAADVIDRHFLSQQPAGRKSPRQRFDETCVALTSGVDSSLIIGGLRQRNVPHPGFDEERDGLVRDGHVSLKTLNLPGHPIQASGDSRLGNLGRIRR